MIFSLVVVVVAAVIKTNIINITRSRRLWSLSFRVEEKKLFKKQNSHHLEWYHLFFLVSTITILDRSFSNLIIIIIIIIIFFVFDHRVWQQWPYDEDNRHHHHHIEDDCLDENPYQKKRRCLWICLWNIWWYYWPKKCHIKINGFSMHLFLIKLEIFSFYKWSKWNL